MVTTTEPTITINGTQLSYAQSNTVRAAIESFMSQLSNPVLLGKDDHGRAMVKLYKLRLNEVRQLIYTEG